MRRVSDAFKLVHKYYPELNEAEVKLVIKQNNWCSVDDVASYLYNEFGISSDIKRLHRKWASRLLLEVLEDLEFGNYMTGYDGYIIIRPDEFSVIYKDVYSSTLVLDAVKEASAWLFEHLQEYSEHKVKETVYVYDPEKERFEPIDEETDSK